MGNKKPTTVASRGFLLKSFQFRQAPTASLTTRTTSVTCRTFRLITGVIVAFWLLFGQALFPPRERMKRPHNLRACLKTSPVRAPGLQGNRLFPGICRPRALTRRRGGVFKQALSWSSSFSLSGGTWREEGEQAKAWTPTYRSDQRKTQPQSPSHFCWPLARPCL
jgi:hypothetical protein